MIRMVLSHASMAAAGVGLLMSASMLPGSATAEAQGDPAPSDTLLVIPGPDGALVPLRSGPGVDQPLVASLGGYAVVTALGPAHQEGVTRWLPVRTAANQIGWVEEPYLAIVGTAAPIATSPSTEPVVAEVPPQAPAVADAPPAPAIASSPVTMEASAPAPPPASASASASTSTTVATIGSVPRSPGRPLEIETRLKYPEAKTRHQEITVLVTRDGMPVPGVLVTIFTGDDEDEPTRVLKPTNVDGRTRREFSIGREKGSIELIVSAVAPDGGVGMTTAKYFRR
jgi:hypothetical protein